MCGIVGYTGHRDAVPILIEGLRRLAYRGYDSAGVAVLASDGRIDVRKRRGKLGRLEDALQDSPPSGVLGIAHTRWATHGPPTTPNAHPHLTEDGRIAVVHNGIIENYLELRAELAARGHEFASDTDTEVIVHLIEDYFERTLEVGRTSPEAGRASAFIGAVRRALGRLEGSYALAAFVSDEPGLIIAARHFSPLVVGLGKGQNYLASDIPALLAETREVIPLEDDEVAVVTAEGVALQDLEGRPVNRESMHVTWDAAAAEKGGYEHFVRKEIDEQPTAIAETLRGRLAGDQLVMPELDELDLKRINRVYMLAAGTSLYAGLVGKLQLERWARLPVEVAYASELRYGDPVLGPETLVVLVSQSGETADTLAAAGSAREAGAPTLAITNVVGSSLTRVADATLYLQVGPEIGVVATKTFTGQLALLTVLAAELGRRRGVLPAQEVRDIALQLRKVPEAVATALESEPAIREVAQSLAGRRSMFFIGRRFGHPVALEGALKLKEISYIHAEGYPAGELKHGPIAMLEPAIPVFAIATSSPTYDKLVSNIEEVRARGVEVTAIATEGDERISWHAEHVFYVPHVREELAPMVDVVPTQLFAYHVAVALGRDVDKPRNLAKSVTVE
jgi:glucosamine--fructose-6-phosphate aminotransferase (isomerizing)